MGGRFNISTDIVAKSFAKFVNKRHKACIFMFVLRCVKADKKTESGLSINQTEAQRKYSERMHFDRVSISMRGLGRGKKRARE